MSKSTINSKGYANYDSRVFWAPTDTSIDASSNGKANVTNVGGAATPSPWLTYDQGGNLVEYTDTVTAAIQAPDSENKENVPVYFKVHGGIANATEYQLWITATGTSNPYGQVLGSMYQYGGARVGFIPGDNKQTKKRSAEASSLADVMIGTSFESSRTVNATFVFVTSLPVAASWCGRCREPSRAALGASTRDAVISC